MKKISTIAVSALATIALTAGCTAEMQSEEEIASAEQSICEDREGVNAALAALAVAVGKEVRRFQPKTDLRYGSSGMLELTPEARARCPGGVCKNAQAMLDMQKWEAHGKVEFPGGSKLDVGVFRSRLWSFVERQTTCNNRIDNHKGDDCPAEAHDLKFVSTSKGVCGTDYRFHAYKAGTTKPLAYPAQLKNKLIWAGEPYNPFLDFNVIGDDITLDPTAGLVEGDPSASGSCAATCTKFSVPSLVGQCCSCNGKTKRLARSPFSSYMYLCQ